MALQGWNRLKQTYNVLFRKVIEKFKLSTHQLNYTMLYKNKINKSTRIKGKKIISVNHSKQSNSLKDT